MRDSVSALFEGFNWFDQPDNRLTRGIRETFKENVPKLPYSTRRVKYGDVTQFRQVGPARPNELLYSNQWKELIV